MKVARRFMDMEYGQVHYRESGEQKTKGILLLHEMPLSSKVFEEMLPNLGEQYYVVTPDLPGFGDSYKNQSPITIEEMGNIILKFIEKFDIEEWAIFGVHGGASVAIEMAGNNADFISSLILSGVPLFTEREREQFHKGLSQLDLKLNGTHFIDWWESFNKKFGPGANVEMIHEAVLQIMKAGANYEWGYRAAFDYDPSVVLKKLKQPIYLLTAKNDVLISKNENAKKLNPNIQNEKTLDVEGQLSQRAPEETAEEILMFLKANNF